MKTPLAAALLPAAALLLAGCFEHGFPKRDVVATSLGQPGVDRVTVTFLNLSGSTNEPGFPEGLASFPALRRLSMRGRTDVTNVPPSITDAATLRELDLSGTGIRDLPAAFASLPALRHLYIADNALVRLPNAICGLPALTYLNLDRNRLESLPDDIGGLASLKWVRLNENRLRDLPVSCANWKSVRRLYLRGNGLEKVPEAILSMTALEELDLGNNRIAQLPEALCALPNLRRIDLDGNPTLTALPASIGSMKNLSHLFLFGCPISSNEQARIRAALPDPVRRFIAF